MSKTQTLPRRKVLVLGNSVCGKTQLVKAQQGKDVSSRHVPSLLEASLVSVSLPSHRKVELEVWEVGGGNNAADLLKLATTGSDITAAICFSIDDPESLFHAYQYWRIQLRILAKDPRILLVACKSDLRNKRQTETSHLTRRPRRPTSRAASSRTTSSKSSTDSGISMSSSSSDNPQKPPRRRKRNGLKKEESSSKESSTPALISSIVVNEAASNIDADVLECSSYDLRSVQAVFQKLGEMALS